MVSWTCQRVVLNWPMFRSRGVSRFRDATVRSRVPGDGNISPWCVPGRQSVASFALHVSQKVPRTGKSPVRGKIRALCIRKRAGFGKIRAPCIRNALQIAFREYTARRSCHEGDLFAAQTPRIMHDARILPSLGVSFECCGRGEGCRRSACGSRTPPLCARRRALLNWLALRMRVTPTAPLPRLCCGRSDGIGGGLPHRVAASARLTACVQPLLARGFIAPPTLRPKQRDRVVYRRKRGAVMVFR